MQFQIDNQRKQTMQRMVPQLLLSLCILLSACTLPPALTLNASNSIWPEIRNTFSLPADENNPRVKAQIAWYQAHKTLFIRAFTRARPYMHFIYTQIQQSKMPGEIILIPMIESEYTPFAYSWAGATGLWQMMPGTASGMKLKINWWIDERRDIIKSTHAALKYLQHLNDFFKGNWFLAIAAYDSGAGRVRTAVQKAGTDNFWALKLPNETEHYIPKLLALRAIILNPEQYGFVLPEIKNEPYFQTIKMQQPISLQDVAKMAGISTEEIRLLNPGFRRWSTVPKGQYTLLIPKTHHAQFKAHLKQFNPKAHTIHKHLKKHTIHNNETLSMIAHRHHLSTRRLSEINQLKTEQLTIGQSLWIPHKTPLKLPGFTVQQALKIAADQIPGPQRYIHIVRKHETLSYIGNIFDVSLQELRFWNQFTPQHHLQAGDKILIWKHTKPHHYIPRYHRVKPGETLSAICKKHGCNPTTVKRLNHLKQIAFIKINQKLRIQ